MIAKVRQMLTNKEDGFTLVELMVVVAVIGILAGIAIPKFTGVRNKADIASVKSDLRNIQTGLEMYYADNGEYPEKNGWVSDVESYVTINDLKTTNYNYTAPTSSSSYEVTKTINSTTVTLTPGGISE